MKLTHTTVAVPAAPADFAAAAHLPNHARLAAIEMADEVIQVAAATPLEPLEPLTPSAPIPPTPRLAPEQVQTSGAANLSSAMVSFVAGGSSLQGSSAGGYKAAALRPNPSLPSLSTEPKTMVMKNGQAVQSMLLRIALLEDCQIEAEGISRLFEDSGYKVVSYGSGATFLKMLENETFDLIVLDWNVPDTTGIEVLHSIRHERNITTPVLMLTSRAGEYDIVQALNRGADDYLQKPWMPFELIARVNALLRRQRYVQVVQDERFSDFLLDAKQQQITRNGKIICLSSKEFLLAQVFLRHLGSPLSRAHITETVWNDTNIETRTVDVHISRLRNKLGLTKENGFNLVAIYGYGYRLERLASPEHPVLKK